jgi:hypothetical protein
MVVGKMGNDVDLVVLMLMPIDIYNASHPHIKIEIKKFSQRLACRQNFDRRVRKPH